MKRQVIFSFTENTIFVILSDSIVLFSMCCSDLSPPAQGRGLKLRQIFLNTLIQRQDADRFDYEKKRR